MKSNSYLTVSQLIQGFNLVLNDKFCRVDLEAEISEFMIHRNSGHAYFSLKDNQAVINAVMWRSTVQRLKFKPEVGQKVLCRAEPSIYPKSGRLQIIVNSMQLAGEGDLQQKFLELKAKLEKEGLFAAGRKRPIPAFPEKIGIITSESGAVLHDMLDKFNSRYPQVKILLYSASVQGPGAAEKIAEGIEFFNAQDDSVDTLIVARGGGSLEDLWCFNEEVLVRAIFASNIPVIAGIGHEPDVTLSDLVADLRASTPTAAAVHSVPDRAELNAMLKGLQHRLGTMEDILSDFIMTLDFVSEKYRITFQRLLENCRNQIESAAKNLRLIEPGNLLRSRSSDLSNLESRLALATNAGVQRRQARLLAMEKHYQALNPKTILRRGFALVAKSGSLVKSAQDLAVGDEVELEFADSLSNARIEKCQKK